MRGRWGIATALSAALLAAGLAAAGEAAANHRDGLLADASVCPKQRDVTASAREQKRAMRCLHRHARTNAGRRPVDSQSQLKDAAQAKAADIMRCQQFSHRACGNPVWYWPVQFGYYDPDCDRLAENISWGRGTNASARSVMSAWVHSDQHWATIQRPFFRDIGVGLKRGNFKGNPRSQVWVVLLGRQYRPCL